jgi:beta-phosphoglucomutase-like phosphatase (HAD superfamily)
VVIEDRAAGVQAAVAAGMRVIGFTGGSHCRAGHGERLRAVGATALCGDIRELANLS